MHLDNLITSESKQENRKQTTTTNKQKRGQDWRGDLRAGKAPS